MSETKTCYKPNKEAIVNRAKDCCKKYKKIKRKNRK